MVKTGNRATPHLQNEYPSFKQSNDASGERDTRCLPARSSRVRQVRHPFALKSEAKDIRVGFKDTIRLSWELAVVVLTADVDCSCAPGVGSHCATASGWRGFGGLEIAWKGGR